LVADSDPEAEHNEVLSKAAAMGAAFDLAKEGL
jgi:anthranilate/para-aminobenzoate synthase component I